MRSALPRYPTRRAAPSVAPTVLLVVSVGAVGAVLVLPTENV